MPRPGFSNQFSQTWQKQNKAVWKLTKIEFLWNCFSNSSNLGNHWVAHELFGLKPMCFCSEKPTPRKNIQTQAGQSQSYWVAKPKASPKTSKVAAHGVWVVFRFLLSNFNCFQRNGSTWCFPCEWKRFHEMLKNDILLDEEKGWINRNLWAPHPTHSKLQRYFVVKKNVFHWLPWGLKMTTCLSFCWRASLTPKWWTRAQLMKNCPCWEGTGGTLPLGSGHRARHADLAKQPGYLRGRSRKPGVPLAKHDPVFSNTPGV